MEIEPGITNDYLPMDPKRLLERMHTTLNTRDLTNLLHLLQVDYEQIYPTQPERDTTGLEPARESWERLFERYSDFRADLLRQAIEGNTIWSEWRFSGGERQENPLNMGGVIIFGVEEGLIAWSRFYITDIRS
jgi:hypothetical protein